MATKPKTQIMSHDDTVMSPITKASNVLFEDGETAQDKLEDNVEKSFTPSVENSSSMFKVGQGDSVDLSSSIKEGAYDSCVLKGRSLVNCIQEPSSQDVILPYEFTEGQYVTIDDTKDSGALGVELKGQTLVNLAKVRSKQASNAVGEVNIPIKPNTKYIAFANVTYEDISNLAMFLVSPIYVESTSGLNGDSLYTATVSGKGGTEIRWNQTGVRYVTFTSTSNQCYLHIRTGGSTSNLKYNNMQVFEYQQDMENWDIPYFEGMTSIKAPTVKTVGKNLFDIANSSNGYFSLSNPYGLAGPDFSNKTSAYIKVKPNTQYSYSFDGFAQSQVGNLYWTGFYYYKRVGEVSTVHPSRMTFTGVNQISFTTPSDCNYIRIGSRGLMLDGATVQLEESTTATTYKPYTSSSLTLPEEVILRSLPNGVCDTYNTRTGEYVKRIGEKTLNGSESWGVWQQGGDHLTQKTVVGFGLNLEDAPTTKSFYVLCDRFATGGTTSGADNDHSYYVYHKELIYGYYANASTYRRLGLSVSKTKLGIPNDNTDATQALVSLRAYLASNPIKVQYELATPIITKLPLQSTLKPWNTTTHIYTEIPQNSLYPILSRSNPTYPVILKPSTKYSIVANSYSNNHTNSPINFNLGGATASTTVGNRVTMVTTPSTLSNELLTMSGRGNKLNNIMVIEGDVVGDEPYFEGICDVKSPVVKNVGKNLFDLNGEWVKCTYSYGVPQAAPYTPTITISNNGFSITSHINSYNSGFGQYVDVSSLDILYVRATAIYTDTKTVPELKIIGLYENESIPSSVNSTNSSDFKVITKQLGSEQEVSFDLDVSSYSKIFIMFSGGWKSGMSGSYTFTMKDVYIGSSNQTYEPYKSNTTTFNQKDGKTIVLRSLPSGVCDTLNVETGEYVRRIGEVVITNTTPKNIAVLDNNIRVNIALSSLSANTGTKVANNTISDKFYWSEANAKDVEGLRVNGNTLHWCVSKNKLNSHDLQGVNAYLQANPITIQYELATPIITTIDVQGFPYAYTNGHVQLSSSHSGQSLTPKVEYSLPINRNGQIRMNQAMVERHQKHIDKLQAMIITNMVNTQYRQSLTKINYQLGGE